MPIGMVEISTCILEIREGDRVTKGQKLGYFQFGGSTHCVIFQPGAIKEFVAKENDVVKMGQTIAIATS